MLKNMIFNLMYLFLGGHSEFQRQFREHCETTLLPSAPEEPPRLDLHAHPASRVLPHLYLGNASDARNPELLAQLGVNRILALAAGEESSAQPVLETKTIAATDNCSQNMKQYFEEAFSFIGELTPLFLRRFDFCDMHETFFMPLYQQIFAWNCAARGDNSR